LDHHGRKGFYDQITTSFEERFDDHKRKGGKIRKLKETGLSESDIWVVFIVPSSRVLEARRRIWHTSREHDIRDEYFRIFNKPVLLNQEDYPLDTDKDSYSYNQFRIIEIGEARLESFMVSV
jgi:hypothetical protein